MAITALSCCFMVLYIKGDWSEYAGTFGLPSWASSLRPCFRCRTSPEEMYRMVQISAVSCGGFQETPIDEYDLAARRCETHCVLSKCSHARLLPLLFWDKNKDGSRGLAVRAFPEAGIVAGSRLEPSPCLPDVGDIFNLAVVCNFPFPVVFWYPGNETATRHRNPIFGTSSGLHPTRHLTIDPLHCLYLGVLQAYCSIVIWVMVMSGRLARATTRDEQVQNSLMVLMQRLQTFYTRRHARLPLEKLTRLHDLQPKMIGLLNDKKCKTKGAETYGLLLFLVEELERYGGVASQPALLGAGRAIVGLLTLWATSEWKMTAEQAQSSMDYFNTFKRFAADIEDFEIPKSHLFMHLVRDTLFMGNPRWWSTWKDESLNKTLKRCCRDISQATFDATVLSGMARVLADDFDVLRA